MPNTKSAAKELRKTKKRTLRNKRVKENIKTLTKKIEKAITNSDITTANELAKKLQSIVDKASKKKILKKNTAGRKKSRLLKKINSAKKK